MRRSWVLVLGLAALAACSSGGGEPRQERDLPERITVSSAAFDAGGTIPRRYTCVGENLSPPLRWSGVPEGTAGIALVVDDPDASRGTYVHWVLIGLDPATDGLAEGAVPAGARQLPNSAGDAAWAELSERLEISERTLRRACSALREIEGHGPLANAAAMLARALLLQGRDDEAEALAEECAAVAPDSQRDAQIKHREIRAVVLARRAASLASRGKPDEAAALAAQAERLVRDAVALGEQSEQLDSRAQALYDLAEVLGRAGRWDEAEEALAQARDLWLQKGNLVSARKAPLLVAELRQAGSAA
jgi:phosphatidylethanolamine-binding protein (PEBP) family uncharacterized protein